MLPRTFFFKLDLKSNKSISYISLVEDTLKLHLCYTIKRCLENLAYTELYVSHNYSIKDIDNAYNAVEYPTDYAIINNIREINHIFESNIVDIINHYKLNYDVNSTILNFNSCLISLDTYMFTCLVLRKN